jgi:CBS domain-containing protein
MRVGDVMDRNPPLVPAEISVADLSRRIAAGDPAVARRQGTLIVNPAGRLAGIITRGDILIALQNGNAARTTVLDAGTAGPVCTHADATLHDAIALMLKRNIGRLPVVDRQETGRVLGYLGRAEILSARLHRQEEEERREKGPLLDRAKQARS